MLNSFVSYRIVVAAAVCSTGGESFGDGEQLQRADVIARPTSGGKSASTAALRRVRRISTA